MKLDILAFGAHPDDVEISAAGMLISEANRGRSVGIVDLTRGELGTRGTPEIRKLEAEHAAEIIGAKVRLNLGMPDGLFDLSNENKLQIIELIRTYRPEIVISNAPSDRHPDHGRAAQLVVEACFLAGLVKIELPGSDLSPWRPLAVYQYMQFYHHVPHFIYDVSQVMDKKIESILAHKSQFYNPLSTEPETVIASPHFKENLWARASEYGLQAGFRYGEPFLIVRTPGVKDLFSLY
jgi:bacillithiol biosynthesis deacetylase BshB1